MLQNWQLFLISAAYVLLLFAIAYRGDARAARGNAQRRPPWVYSLALATYATSWTFFGAVGRAAEEGWHFLPIYLGPTLMFVFGMPLVARLINVSKRHNITSIADFIGARYGRRQPLAMLVTVIAVFGVLPYIALQFKAVASSFQILTGGASLSSGGGLGLLGDNSLLIALLLAAFSILFGTRQVMSTETHHGLVLAIAFESAVKLVTFIALGLYVCFGLYAGVSDAYAHTLAMPQIQAAIHRAGPANFIAQTVVAGIAVICLPRQFHVAVVEHASARDHRNAGWLFPLYLGLISIFVLPIAGAGLTLLPAGISPDTYMLALPMSEGHRWLTLTAYIGGFSASTGMVILASISLSTMISNELVMPLLLRSKRPLPGQREGLSGLLKAIRRVAIVALILLAYVYYRVFTGPGSLAALGLLSLLAIAQFGPATFGGLLWRGGSHQGAMAGLLAGFALWAYTLLLPSLARVDGFAQHFFAYGPFGIAWLRPQGFLGLTGFDDLTRGTLCSLGVNLLAYVGVSLFSAPGLRSRLQVERFLGGVTRTPASSLSPRINATVGDLLALLERFFGVVRAHTMLEDYARRHGGEWTHPSQRADAQLVRHCERLLSSALGASSARLMLVSVLSGHDMQLEDVIRLLDETSHEIQFNRELLRASLEHLSQGVSVVDKDFKLVAWNRHYLELFGYPAELVSVGRPIEDLVRYNARKGLIEDRDIETAVARRIAHMRDGHAYTHERALPDGTVLEIRGNPMPGGGFVTSYSDVTAYKQAQAALQENNETLETRVAERTQALTAATEAATEARLHAERTNQAKTRFLASASHDLVQPLNAARLFVAAIEPDSLPTTSARLLAQVGDSLTAAESLLGALLDISRLDATALELKSEHLRLNDVLEPLAAEFSALARARGLDFRLVPSRAVVHTDPRLLRRVLQNFLSNAVRYTRHGRVLMGCRRVPGAGDAASVAKAGNGALRIEIWDTGPGIPADRHREIFEEFRRLDGNDDEDHGDSLRGLGLGLAIAERVARLLDQPLALRSWPGRGSVFSITVPLGNPQALAVPRPASAGVGASPLSGAVVMCLDNEPAILAGLEALLTGWACTVICVRDLNEAQQHWRTQAQVPDLILIDFHLDSAEVNGIEVMTRLQTLWGVEVPGIVLTADHTQRARAAAAAQGYPLLAKPVKPAALRALMGRMLSMNETVARRRLTA